MKHIQRTFKSLAVLFSEILWIYYLISIFTSIEWDQAVLPEATWLLVAGGIGYIINYLLSKKPIAIILILSNIIFTGFIISYNWKDAVPSGAWGFGLALSVGICIIIARTFSLAWESPTRKVILYHFELNLIFYVIFAGILDIRGWDHGNFHLLFILAILASLTGMLFTLEDYKKDENDYVTEIRKLGESGWFTMAMTVVLMATPIFSLIFLLDPIQKGISRLITSLWTILKQGLFTILILLEKLLELLPSPQTIGKIPDTPMVEMNLPPMEEEIISSIPSIIFVVAVILLILVIIILKFFEIIKNKRSHTYIKAREIVIIRESWLKNFYKKIKTILSGLKTRIKMTFPYFYHQQIYWYFYQVKKWGRKRGLAKKKSETSREYITKIISRIPSENNNFNHNNKNYQVTDLLTRLNQDFQSAYYGQNHENLETDYKHLIKELKNIKFKNI